MKSTMTFLVVFSLAFISGTKKTSSPTASPLDGEWELVWSKVNGKINTIAKPNQFKMFHNGFFSLIMKDSTGNWTMAAAGTFETRGNVHKEIFRYCSQSNLMGYTAWQEFEIRGDTLYNRLFTKVVDPTGKDVSDAWTKDLEEKRVRARR